MTESLIERRPPLHAAAHHGMAMRRPDPSVAGTGTTAPPHATLERGVLGAMLVAAGVVTADLLASALAEQRGTRERIGAVLVRRGVDPEAIARVLALQLRMKYQPAPVRAETAAAALLDAELARRLQALPLRFDERSVAVAVADPLDIEALDDLRFRLSRRIEPVVVSVPALAAAIEAAYDAGEVRALARRFNGGAARPRPAASDGAAAEELSALRRASEAAPVVELVNLLVERALARRASDVHIEAAANGLHVRARIDGALSPLFDIPQEAAGAVVSRIKIMAGLDIAVRLRPQDGRATAVAGGGDVALRVSTLPALGGEKVVIRLLRGGAEAPSLDDIGMDRPTRTRIDRMLGQPHGVLLVTGPTGSGKTTTLYAMLAALDRQRRNIVTLEDPVEYRLAGITQVQVHARAGLGFADALRAVLRQDPDVIMVGELRDRESAGIALSAALTGHLVLATLHTNDAPTAATRLCELGMPPYLVSGSLLGVLAQRLARRVCTDCRGSGCSRCDGGFRGRAGVYETMVVDDAVRTRILRRAPAHVIRAAARAHGMRTLAEDARRLVDEGVTSAEEVGALLKLE
ncbi:MAG: GspE/PulE family protein [Longimicrobiales bacterium]